jgi:hypothetical protein
MRWLFKVKPRPLYPRTMTRNPLYRRLGGPQDCSGRVRKMSPKPGFDPRTFRAVASRYTERRNSCYPNARNQWPRYFFTPFLSNSFSSLEMLIGQFVITYIHAGLLELSTQNSAIPVPVLQTSYCRTLCGCFGNECTFIYCVFVLFRLCVFILICY